MATIHFTSSESYMFSEPRAVEHAQAEAIEYVECTYHSLRTGPDGDEIARYMPSKGDLPSGWELPDGRRFSDWAVGV